MAGPRQARMATLAQTLNGAPPAQRMAKPNGLPAPLKAGVEALSGQSMDHVRVHYNSARPAQLQALAHTQGNEIHVGPGQERHLPHEAWHAVQQAQGRVRATRRSKGGVPVNDSQALEREADVMGTRAAQLRADPAASRPGRPAQSGSGSSVVQRRTTVEEQAQIAADVDFILRQTTDERALALRNRVTFNNNPAPFDADIDQFPTFRSEAEAIKAGFGNVFDHINGKNYTNYSGDGLDGEALKMRGYRTVIENVYANNQLQMVDQVKTAMMAGVAKNKLFQKIQDYNGLAFRGAKTLAASQAALTAWDTKYFTVDRSQIIESAKTGAKNGRDNATVWKNISAAIGGHQTHMTVYNGDISNFGPYLVTSLTTVNDSNDLANEVMPDGAHNMGVHLTAEVHAYPTPNPRVFGNPPDTARAYNLGALSANSFVAPLRAAQDTVRGHVWTLIEGKKSDRP